MVAVVQVFKRLLIAVAIVVASVLTALLSYLAYLTATKPTLSLPRARLETLWRESALRQRCEQSGDRPVAVITGCTGGLGEGLAKELFRLGFLVVLASRSAAKLAQVSQEIRTQYPDSPGALDEHVLDVSDLDSVRVFAHWFEAKYGRGRLHVLVNNAGMHYADGKTMFDEQANILSKQGYDLAFATNYLGHFLLTELLLPLIEEGRVINISSSYHFQADGHTLEVRDGHAPDASIGVNRDLLHKRRAYSVTKLANVLHANELQRRLQREGRSDRVQALVVCPGWVATGIIPQHASLGRIIHRAAFSVETGLLSTLSAILEPSFVSLGAGQFVCNCKPPIFTEPYGKDILAWLTRWGLRDDLIDVYAFFLSLVQAHSYGLTIFPCSVEGANETIARNLRDWSEKELRAKGYLN